jgi:GTP-binding protein HflX
MEVDRRKIEKHIDDLKEELKGIEGRKERMVHSRAKDHFMISLVGYTNAGKSTLMRSLTGEDVLVEDKLFATLDTKTSTLKLGGGIQVLLSDTVGFIRRLPHDLVASFHATLEEARHADLLLHVADASSPHVYGQIDAVCDVLKQIGAHTTPTLMVLNKVDALGRKQPPHPELDTTHAPVHPDPYAQAARERAAAKAAAILAASTGPNPAAAEAWEVDYRALLKDYPAAIPISALHNDGLDRLRSEIRDRVREEALPISVAIHAGDGKLLSYLATHFFEDSRDIEDETIILHGRCSNSVLDKLKASDCSAKILKSKP